MTDTTTPTWQPATTTCEITAGPAASIPAGTPVQIAPVVGHPGTFYVNDQTGRVPFLAERETFRLGHSGPTPELEPRTWGIPAEPVGVETVWTTDARTGEPVRWTRDLDRPSLGAPWIRDGRTGVRYPWRTIVLEHAPVTEYPRCQDIAPALADEEGGWPGPCTGWARNVDDVVDGRFAGLYCPPCRIRAAADAVAHDPVQGPIPAPGPLEPGLYVVRGQIGARALSGDVIAVQAEECGDGDRVAMTATGARFVLRLADLDRADLERVGLRELRVG